MTFQTNELNMYLNCPIPSVSSFTRLLHTKLIDLNDYYRNDKERQIIRCQICNCDVSREEVFQHTVSKRHKYNKLFVAISQNCSNNIDVDFIVLSIDRLQCRYCETVIINSNEDERHVISHIQDTGHVNKKQDWLNRMSCRSAGASTVRRELLQPLDSLITHDKIYQKRGTKSAKKIKKKESLLIKSDMIIRQPKVINNAGLNDILKYSTFSSEYEREKGEALPECIIIGNGATCTCTICVIEIPKSTYNVGGHIHGKKHKKKTLESIKSTCQIVEIIDSNQKSPTEPVKLLNYRTLKETAKDFSDTYSISQSHVSHYTAFLEDENALIVSRKELSDCISMREDGARICTVCVTEIPNTPLNIDEHLNGMKHKAKMGMKHKAKMEVKLENANQSTVPHTKILCTTCGKWIKNTKHGMSQHKKTPKHQAKVLQSVETTHQKLNLQATQQSMVASVSTAKTSSYMCLICCLMVPSDTRSIDIHNSGKKHKKHALNLTAS